MIIGIVIACTFLAGMLSIIYNKISPITYFVITTAIAFVVFHYQLYSPVLKIKVPNGYRGEINLVLSNIHENILEVDSNGIGYLTKWTFNKVYSKPVVEQIDGKNLDKNLVGFNRSTFFGKTKSCCVNRREIESLNFEIVLDEKNGEKQYYSKNFIDFVNKSLLYY